MRIEILFLLIMLLACQQEKSQVAIISQLRYKNGVLKKLVLYYESDTTFKYIRFFATGDTQLVINSKFGKQHGPERRYHGSGYIQTSGTWLYGQRVGTFYEYEYDGKLKAIRKYTQHWNASKGFPNEVIYFDRYGDTVKNSSVFYKLFSVADTISVNEMYRMKIALPGHLFENAFVCVCDYDSLFNHRRLTICDTIEMFEFESHIRIAPQRKGINIVRGKIVNYENYTMVGQTRHKMVEVFFEDQFYAW